MHPGTWKSCRRQTQGIRGALIPGGGSRTKTGMQAGGAGKGRQLSPQRWRGAEGRLQVEKTAGRGLRGGEMSAGGG